MPAPQFVQARRTTLKTSITAAEASSIVLSSLVDVYGNALAFSDFGSTMYLTIAPGTTSEEIISAGGFTVNSDGSVTIDTSITRGLSAVSPYGSGGTASAHPAGTAVIVSNNPQLYDAMLDFLVNLEDAQTIAGKKTFSTVPASSAAPTSGSDLTTKTYVDALALGAITSINVIVDATAGETLVAGNLVYLNTADGEWYKCDADTASTVENVLLAIAQGAGVDGGAIAGGVLLRGIDEKNTGLTAGEIQYASNTAGEIANSAGTTEVTVGVATQAGTLYFSPRYNQMLTEDQQDALAGTSGTPSGSNKFVTSDDVASAKTASKIARRDANSDVLVATTPTDSDAATSKTYVDSKIAQDGILSILTSTLNLTSSTTETNIFSFTLPGGSLVANSVVEFVMPVQLTMSNTNSVIFRLKYGSTTISTLDLTQSTGGTVSGLIGELRVRMFAVSASSQKGFIQAVFIKDGGATIDIPVTEDAQGFMISGYGGTSTEDSSGDLTLAVTVQHDTTSEATVVYAGAICKLMRGI